VNDGQHPLDRFVHGPAAQFAAFVWGLAEATLFFIVPDVLLTAIGCRSIRAGFKATGFAILGALLGGLIMYLFAGVSPETSQTMLTYVPAIHPRFVDDVRSQLLERGLIAVLFGPTEGVPYKIYAVEWGVRHGNLPLFLLISIPARGIRFLFSILLAGGISRMIAPWTKRRAQTEMTVLALFWVVFYAFYFTHFGW
jgi:membrane protein YqaA with SNARE-associated domain